MQRFDTIFRAEKSITFTTFNPFIFGGSRHEIHFSECLYETTTFEAFNYRLQLSDSLGNKTKISQHEVSISVMGMFWQIHGLFPDIHSSRSENSHPKGSGGHGRE